MHTKGDGEGQLKETVRRQGILGHRRNRQETKEKRHLSDTAEENVPEGKKTQATVESLKQKIDRTCAQEVIGLGAAGPCRHQAGTQRPPLGWTSSD